VEVSAKNEHEHGLSNPQDYQHAHEPRPRFLRFHNSAFILAFTNSLVRSGPYRRRFMDKTKPHDPFLKDGAKRKCAPSVHAPPRCSLDGSLAHAEGWTKSLSGIGHIARMAQILYWAQSWFGLGTTTEHDHVSRTRQFSGSRSRGFPEHEPGHDSLPSVSLSALIIHPCLNALPSPQVW